MDTTGSRVVILNRNENYTGMVLKVCDGDSFTMVIDGAFVRCRLYGIDAPELSQPYGNYAYVELKNILEKLETKVRFHGSDKYGRLLTQSATFAIGDVSRYMLRAGLAYYYSPKRRITTYIEAETDARNRGEFIWSQKEIVKPWQYRKKNSVKVL